VSCITGQQWKCLECKPASPINDDECLSGIIAAIGTTGHSHTYDEVKFSRYLNYEKIDWEKVAKHCNERQVRSLCIKEALRDTLEHCNKDGSARKGDNPLVEHYSSLFCNNNIKFLAIDQQMDFVIPPNPPDNLYPDLQTDSYKSYSDVYKSLRNFVHKKDIVNLKMSKLNPGDLLGLPVRQKEGNIVFVKGEAKGHTVRNDVVSYFGSAGEDDFMDPPAHQETSMREFNEELSQVKIMITDGDDEHKATPAQLELAKRNKWWDKLLG